MRNRFYDADSDGEDDCCEGIRIALNWVLYPTLADTEITDYLPKPSQPAG